MPQEDDQTAQVHKAQEILRLVLVALGEAPETKKPGEEPFDLPATLVAAHRSTIGPTRAVSPSHRRDQEDVLLGELLFERRAVVRSVADDALRFFFGEALVDGGLNESYFVTFTRSDRGRYRKTRAVCDRQDLGGSSATSFSHKRAPFFAPAWVPSMKVSLRFNRPRSTRSSASPWSTCFNVPVSTQLWKRRKHVAYGGYRSGMSAHGAPVRRIHSTPLSTSRGSRHGRPRPSSRTCGFGSSFSTAAHCSSLRSITTLDHKVDPRSIASLFSI